MKKSIVIIVLGLLAVIGISISVKSGKKEQEPSCSSCTACAPAEAAETMLKEAPPVETAIEKPAVATEPVEESITPPAEVAETSRRMMKNMAKMMENPTMNKVMEASQRGAIGALYSDLLEYLNLDADETTYFMDLLMHRQMKNMELGMKMMSDNLSDEEKQALVDEIQEADTFVKTEMKKFLNSESDYDEFEFYEKTMGERMILSQMDQNLSGSDEILSDETYRDLLGMMHEQKNDFDFTSDLHDDKNTDISPTRFSKQNLDNFANDMDRLNETIVDKAGDLLTAEQLKAFEQCIKTTSEMQKSQLEMAAQMFGGGK